MGDRERGEGLRGEVIKLQYSIMSSILCRSYSSIYSS